jgi:hypothetical protein
MALALVRSAAISAAPGERREVQQLRGRRQSIAKFRSTDSGLVFNASITKEPTAPMSSVCVTTMHRFFGNDGRCLGKLRDIFQARNASLRRSLH